MIIKIKLLEGAIMPKYQSKGAACFDLHIHSFKKLYKGDQEVDFATTLRHSIRQGFIQMRPGERLLAGTGLFMEIPEGYQLEIKSRSGTTLKTGIVIANQPGTVDSDYRGELHLILMNTTPFLAKIDLGDRVAQAGIIPAPQAEFEIITDLSETERGEGGFGSTGTK
jgi:dUTP pyrophosphatase